MHFVLKDAITKVRPTYFPHPGIIPADPRIRESADGSAGNILQLNIVVGTSYPRAVHALTAYCLQYAVSRSYANSTILPCCRYLFRCCAVWCVCGCVVALTRLHSQTVLSIPLYYSIYIGTLIYLYILYKCEILVSYST